MKYAMYKKIAWEIRHHLAAGRWTPGEKIPTRAELIEEFGGSDLTLHRAVKLLCEEGWLVARRREGTRVAEVIPTLKPFGLVFPCRQDALHRASKYCVALAEAGDEINRRYPNMLKPFFLPVYNAPEQDPDYVALRDAANEGQLRGLMFPDPPYGVYQRLRDFFPKLPMCVLSDEHALQGLHCVAPDMTDFRQQALALANQAQVRRIGLILGSADLELVREWQSDAAAMGLRLADRFIGPVSFDMPASARYFSRLWKSLPRNEAPEAVVVADDHLLEETLQGLREPQESGGPGIPVISHANFTSSLEPDPGVTLLGFEPREILETAFDVMMEGSRTRNEDRSIPCHLHPATALRTAVYTAGRHPRTFRHVDRNKETQRNTP